MASSKKASTGRPRPAPAAPSTRARDAAAATLDVAGVVDRVRSLDDACRVVAGRAVNASLTLRNWLIGSHIDAYELRGTDRAAYGERLLTELAQRLTAAGVSNCNRRQLYRYLRFHRVYPEMVGTLSPQFLRLHPELGGGREEADDKVGTPSPRSSARGDQASRIARELVEQLSYSHIEQLVDLETEEQRRFYERECLRAHWSVRELKRQIGALTFERSALSTRPESLRRPDAEASSPRADLVIRDPYVFEFLGLTPREALRESDLEESLLDRLQTFLLELGHGFCFEARQKRILIGDTYGFVDLVFYHRVLKCHVLVELKVADFTHENLGQLNTYVSWFKRHMMTDGDQPPIGLLLCTGKDHALVEYALADLPNRLFVSKYQLELPSRERVQEFLTQQLEEVRHG